MMNYGKKCIDVKHYFRCKDMRLPSDLCTHNHFMICQCLNDVRSMFSNGLIPTSEGILKM